MVCTIFLADFFVRWYFSQEGWHFLGHHIFLLLISIPYLNIVYISSAHLSHATWVLLRLIPIARGIYGISIIVSWMTRSKVTNLFVTYLSIVFVIIYFCSIMFYFVEHGPNPMVKDYWDAFNWSLMNVTTGRFQHLPIRISIIAGCYPSRFGHGIFSDFHCIRSEQLPEKAERSGNTDTQLILKT